MPRKNLKAYPVASGTAPDPDYHWCTGHGEYVAPIMMASYTYRGFVKYRTVCRRCWNEYHAQYHRSERVEVARVPRGRNKVQLVADVATLAEALSEAQVAVRDLTTLLREYLPTDSRTTTALTLVSQSLESVQTMAADVYSRAMTAKDTLVKAKVHLTPSEPVKRAKAPNLAQAPAPSPATNLAQAQDLQAVKDTLAQQASAAAYLAQDVFEDVGNLAAPAPAPAVPGVPALASAPSAPEVPTPPSAPEPTQEQVKRAPVTIDGVTYPHEAYGQVKDEKGNPVYVQCKRWAPHTADLPLYHEEGWPFFRRNPTAQEYAEMQPLHRKKISDEILGWSLEIERKYKPDMSDDDDFVL